MFMNAIITGVGFAVAIYWILVITRVTSVLSRGLQAFLDLTFTVTMFFVGSITGTAYGLVTAVAGGLAFSALLTVTRAMR